MKIDLHTHTTASFDGINTPKSLIRAAIKHGLSGLAVTDHNKYESANRVREAAPAGFIVIDGIEYATDFGHILALFCGEFASGVKRDKRGLFSLPELSAFVRERGGVLVAAHPFKGRDSLPQSLFKLVDGLESANARDLSRSVGDGDKTAEAALRNGLFVTGGSDGHLPFEVGGAYTIFPDGLASSDELIAALKGGLCRAEGKAGKKIYKSISRLWLRVRSGIRSK